MLIDTLMYHAGHHESKRLITIVSLFDTGPIFLFAHSPLFFSHGDTERPSSDMSACMFHDKLQALTLADYFGS